MKICIKGQRIESLSTPLIVADTVDYITAAFHFMTSDWDGLTKYAHFSNGSEKYDIKLIDDVISADKHLNFTEGEWTLWVHGESFENGKLKQRIPTNEVTFHVQSTGTTETGNPFPSAVPSVTEQIMAEIGKLDELKTVNKQTLVDAINEAFRAAGGEISPEQIAAAVEQHLKDNPIGGDFITEETDPTVPEWAKQPEKPTYTAEEIGADSAGTAAGAVSVHNIDVDSHNDIRLLIEELARRFNALADSEDIDLDQLSEIIAYIQANRELIDSVTTSKISYADIVDNLTTNVSNRPLSAAQGAALKQLIDALSVPTKLSQLEGDTTHRTVTDAEKVAWSAKSDYNPNLLHNADWAFALVNQRGHSGAVSEEYCIDRWIGSGTVMPAAGQHVALSKGTTMTQRMEILPAALGDKQLCFSIDIDGEIQSIPIVFPSVGSVYSNGISLDGCDVELGFVSSSGTSICGVQSTAIPYLKITPTADINIKRPFLEFGKVSHMVKTPPRDYGDVLLTCQRYFVVYGTSSLSYPCLAVAQNETTGTMIVNLPCAMRTVSLTAVITGSPTLRMGTKDYGTINSFSQARNSSANSLHGIFNAVADETNGGMTEGITYIVRMAAGTSISFSADL